MPRYRTVAAVLAAIVLTASAASAQRASPEDLAEAGPFEEFAALIEMTGEGLPDLGRLTVFAPTDEAFARLPEALRDALLSDSAIEARRSVVRAHVVRGWQEEEDLPVEMETVGGDRLLVSYTDGALTFRLASPEDTADPAAVDDSRDVEVRFLAGGSARVGHLLIHPVDRVLLPAALSDSLEGQEDGPARLSVAEPAESETAGTDAAAAIARVDDAPTGAVVPEAELAESPEAPVADPEPLAAPAPEGEVLTLDPVSRPGGEENGAAAPADADGDEAAEGDRADTGAAAARDAGADPAARTAASPEAGRDLSLTRPVTSVSGLLGSPVLDEAGSEMGEVTDLLMALATGEVETVVIATDSGVLGLGETETRRVPLDRLAIDPLTGDVILRADETESDGPGDGGE